jgi:hypothetical protein
VSEGEGGGKSTEPDLPRSGAEGGVEPAPTMPGLTMEDQQASFFLAGARGQGSIPSSRDGSASSPRTGSSLMVYGGRSSNRSG